jgi:hypothetical protein
MQPAIRTPFGDAYAELYLAEPADTSRRLEAIGDGQQGRAYQMTMSKGDPRLAFGCPSSMRPITILLQEERLKTRAHRQRCPCQKSKSVEKSSDICCQLLDFSSIISELCSCFYSLSEKKAPGDR